MIVRVYNVFGYVEPCQLISFSPFPSSATLRKVEVEYAYPYVFAFTLRICNHIYIYIYTYIYIYIYFFKGLQPPAAGPPR